MARGVKGTRDYDAELAKLDAKIKRHNEAIKNLGVQRNEILAQKQEAEYKTLYDVIAQQGLTANDVIKMIENAKRED